MFAATFLPRSDLCVRQGVCCFDNADRTRTCNPPAPASTGARLNPLRPGQSCAPFPLCSWIPSSTHGACLARPALPYHCYFNSLTGTAVISLASSCCVCIRFRCCFTSSLGSCADKAANSLLAPRTLAHDFKSMQRYRNESDGSNTSIFCSCPKVPKVVLLPLT